jgi:hypothetical protein
VWCVLGLLLALSFYCVFRRSRQPQFELSLSRVLDVRDANSSPRELVPHSFRWPIEDTNDDWVVIIRVRNLSSRVLTLGSETVQLKVTGKWQPAKQVAWLNSMYFAATVAGRSDDEFVAAVVPHHTEAVRLSFDYLYQTLAGTWYRQCGYYGYAPDETSFPKLVGWAAPRLGKMLDTPRFQHWSLYAPVTYELTLPSSVHRQLRASEHNFSLDWTGSSRFSLVAMATPLAAAPGQ